MSADNWIYILHTKDNRKDVKFWKEKFQEWPVDAYRVAHCQAIDNFEWLIENEIHNLWLWMESEFWESKIFYSHEEAYKHAEKVEKDYWWTEYWIQTVDATKYNFPWY
jgi:hypothetical protein